ASTLHRRPACTQQVATHYRDLCLACGPVRQALQAFARATRAEGTARLPAALARAAGVVEHLQPDGLCPAFPLQRHAGPAARDRASAVRQAATALAHGAEPRGGGAFPRGGAAGARPHAAGTGLRLRTALEGTA